MNKPINIAVLDSSDDHVKELRTLVSKLHDRVCVFWCKSANRGWEPKIPDHTCVDLFLCHLGDRPWFLDNNPEVMHKSLATASVMIAYSGGRPRASEELRGWYRVNRALDGKNELTEPEWNSLVEWVEGGAEESEVPPMLRGAPLPTAIAIDILCKGFYIALKDISNSGGALETDSTSGLSRPARAVIQKSWWLRGLSISRPDQLREKLEAEGVNKDSISAIMLCWSKMLNGTEVQSLNVLDLHKEIRALIGCDWI